MSRSLWKGVFFSNEMLNLKGHNFKLSNRSSIFLNSLNNKVVNIHNGKEYVSIKCNKDGMVGHKLGEFAFTKKKCIKVKKDKKNFKLKK